MNYMEEMKKLKKSLAQEFEIKYLSKLYYLLIEVFKLEKEIFIFDRKDSMYSLKKP